MSDPRRLLRGVRLTTDLQPDGVLHIMTVRSPISRGRLNAIRFPPLPREIVGATAAEIPGRNSIERYNHCMPFLSDESVCYAGEPVALLCGPDLDTLGDLARRVRLDHAEEEPLFSFEGGHVVQELLISKGEWPAQFAGAYRVVEGEYETGCQEDLGTTPRAVVAIPSGREMVVFCSCAHPFLVRENVAAMLGCPSRRVRVIVPGPDCALTTPLLYPALMAGHAALMAHITGTPTKLVYTQKECLPFTPKRHPSLIKYRTAVDSEGNIRAMDVDITLDGGAYTALAPEILERTVAASCGAYRCENIRVAARLLKTNRPPSGEVAGRGEPQAFFAAELHAARLIEEFQHEPVKWRSRNLVASAGVLATGVRIDSSDPRPIVDDVVERSDFRRKYAAYEATRKRGSASSSGPMRGIGLAVAFHGVGLLGATESRERSAVKVVLNTNKKLQIFSSLSADRDASDWARVAAEILDIPERDVSLEVVDTASVPDSGPAAGSRAAALTRSLLRRCCEAVRDSRLRSLPPIEVKRRRRTRKGPVWTGVSPTGAAYRALCWEATVVEVEVDPMTFEVRCRGVWTTVEGDGSATEREQAFVESAVVYNLDFLLSKNGAYRGGRWVEGMHGEHPVLGVRDVPPISVRILDLHKHGMGDLPAVGVAPAGAAAIWQATSVATSSIPLSAVDIEKKIAAAQATRLQEPSAANSGEREQTE